ncbi:MAG: GNAT family N-acetyltransferase [Chitinispirillia bacterium]
MKTEIRAAENNDLEQIQLLFHKMFKIYSFEQNVNYPFSEHGTNYLKDRINSGMCIISQERDSIIGFIVGNISNSLPFKTYARHGFIENLFVEADYRNVGIGKSLVIALIDIFIRNDVYRINADSEDKPELRKFYKKIGFIETGIQYEFRSRKKL